MGALYYVDAARWLRAVGLVVYESDGWQTRARSSGGFAAPPLGIQWHHTASATTPANDVHWQTEGSDDAPIGNMTLMRDGSIWMIAAGAANTAGKGGPLTLSRGVVPADSGNSNTWAIEAANDGVGERWPAVQIDAYMAATIELNRHFGNRPDDVFTHALGAGDGWTDRKIDPATAAAVEGPWRPRSVTSSGTWALDDIRAELRVRAADVDPDPTPTPPDPEDDMPRLIYAFREYANTWSDTGVHLSAEAFTALVEAGAVVVTSELTYPKNQHLDSLLRISGLDDSYLVPK
jgi:N-acetylmuramoyl-L-alanine amidase-like protein